ncbi:Zn-ribbon domain-containing OB-fold protein [Sphingomonas flavalba]|uniref:Zn-ribbon domain-containing OB-fold protein n=1 Tax=Sphingomonas flavalba TaxID=2559804 RepID=UPI00109E00D3|nr:OB-fold domain-containing protein [Sphingomonas flavalba]
MKDAGGATSDAAEAHWRAALAEGRFLLQRAVNSGTVVFPPRVAEPGTGDPDLEWFEASGMGTVYSVTIVAQRHPEAPYNVALIDLDEGARMMSRVDGVASDAVRIGMRVRARIIAEGDAPLIVFDPVGR